MYKLQSNCCYCHSKHPKRPIFKNCYKYFTDTQWIGNRAKLAIEHTNLNTFFERYSEIKYFDLKFQIIFMRGLYTEPDMPNLVHLASEIAETLTFK